MTLSPGARLGPYEILAAIGAGGMGEVYKARDTRLDRSVAIKILPAHVSADPERRARFEREAKTIAGLSHPHICTLHDVGEHLSTTSPHAASESPVLYLVMELLTGETLAQRLEHGPLSLEQALTVATDIADALSAAHRQGVIHRDLKPGNVMLTKSGAKLLDFGLAKLKAHGEQPAAASLASAPTRTAPLTTEGQIVGTLQYMAPEQVEGKPADARTDLWALGAIVYEMVTGQRAFEGTSPASVITAIMSWVPPPISSREAMTPPLLDWLVKRCLAKDPDERWQNAHDAADELRWIAEAHAQTSVGPPRQPAVHLILTDQRPASPADPQRSLAISRDGQTVVYAAETGGVQHLYLRRLESLQSAMIAGTAGAMAPFLSPDGDRAGFFAEGQLKVVSLGGGAPVTLAAADSPRGATWARGDTIIFAPELDAGLWQIPAGGGTATLIARPDVNKRERSYRWPEMLPDDDTIVFTLAMSDILSFDEGRLMARSLRTGEQHELLRGGSFPIFAETGHLLYARAGAVLAAPFDVKRKVVTGVPASVMAGVVTYPINGSAQFAVSRTGTLVFVPGGSTTRASVLNWVDRNGKTQSPAGPPAAYQAVRVSPDGRAAALDIDGANASIWILDLARSAMTRLTLEWNNNGAEWSPDGSRVVFASVRAGRRGLFSQAVDGRTGLEPLSSATSEPPNAFTQTSWSPDGRVLAFDRLDPNTGWDIWTIAMEQGHPQTPFLNSSFNERSPRFSPDGRWIAYTSDETGRPEVYVQPYPGPGRKARISTDGGKVPVWARDGRELFYRGLDDTSMMSVTMVSWRTRSPGQPRELFQRQSPYPFDVAPDGRFLIIEDPPEGRPLSPVAVILNWAEELKAKVPTGR